jgi:hypothetical protein
VNVYAAGHGTRRQESLEVRALRDTLAALRREALRKMLARRLHAGVAPEAEGDGMSPTQGELLAVIAVELDALLRYLRQKNVSWQTEELARVIEAMSPSFVSGILPEGMARARLQALDRDWKGPLTHHWPMADGEETA